jgi:hypothetical protein
VLAKPELASDQPVPISVERRTPALGTPAKVYPLVELMARHWTVALVNPDFTLVHLVPLSVERKTPLSVAAKIYPLELIAREYTVVLVRPLLTLVQLVPKFVER